MRGARKRGRDIVNTTRAFPSPRVFRNSGQQAQLCLPCRTSHWTPVGGVRWTCKCLGFSDAVRSLRASLLRPRHFSQSLTCVRLSHGRGILLCFLPLPLRTSYSFTVNLSGKRTPLKARPLQQNVMLWPSTAFEGAIALRSLGLDHQLLSVPLASSRGAAGPAGSLAFQPENSLLVLTRTAPRRQVPARSSLKKASAEAAGSVCRDLVPPIQICPSGAPCLIPHPPFNLPPAGALA